MDYFMAGIYSFVCFVLPLFWLFQQGFSHVQVKKYENKREIY